MAKTAPYVGTKDYIYDDFAVLDYIFWVWKTTLLKLGYDQYILPLVEHVEMFTKSGDDLAQKELYDFKDKGGRHIAIRPEATPGTARMIAKLYRSARKPIRVFSILNFMRYERPQAGRLREFWQLNVDAFGKDTFLMDAEILGIVNQIMHAFGAPAGSFKILVNSRQLMDSIINIVLQGQVNTKSRAATHATIRTKTLKPALYRIIDKYTKISKQEMSKMLHDLGLARQEIDFFLELGAIKLTNLQSALSKFIQKAQKNNLHIYIDEFNASLARLSETLDLVKDLGPFEFAPYIVRGLDYYDGIVFEVFEATGKIRRALAGGGRYNSLGKMFGIDAPAVGFGMGNVTLAQFLETYNLLPTQDAAQQDPKTLVYVPVLDYAAYPTLLKIAQNVDTLIKHANKKIKQFAKSQVTIKLYKVLSEQKAIPECLPKYRVQLGSQLESVPQALRTANKINADYVVILGTDELGANVITVKYLR